MAATLPTGHTTVEIPSLLGDAGAAAMVELCERFGRYGMYSQEHVDSPIGVGLPQRYDALANFLRTGGRTGNPSGEDLRTLGARTNYFREEYAYGLEPRIAGIEPFLHHAFANLMVPGQELAVHTEGDPPPDPDLSRLLIDSYIRFPAP